MRCGTDNKFAIDNGHGGIFAKYHAHRFGCAGHG